MGLGTRCAAALFSCLATLFEPEGWEAMVENTQALRAIFGETFERLLRARRE